MSGDDSHLLTAVRAQLPQILPDRVGVAVSGGGDSVALVHMLARCLRDEPVTLHAVTVDHGLRPGSAAEAASVADLAAGLGIPHDILRWQGWDGTGNLQDQARRARYRLLTGWARDRDIPLLALAHTVDDQAETVLMRLGRASGAAGLAAIPPRRVQDGVTLIRPLLDVTRADLRTYLRRNGVAWIDDPSNDDPRFDRVKARQALQALAPLGITVQALADVARNMAQVRDALAWYAFVAARDLIEADAGDLLIDLRGFRVLPEETARQLLARAVQWVGGADYPPRRVPLASALDAIRRGGSAGLGGCLVLRRGGRIRVCREHAAVRDLSVPAGEVWDGRWQLTGGDPEGYRIAAVGQEGLGQCPKWRETGRPAVALIASPGVWRGAHLVAAPLAGKAQGWTAELRKSAEEFFASILTH